MNRSDLRKVLKFCENHTFGHPEFSELAGDLADMLHDPKSPYVINSDTRHVAALIKWQAMQLNSEWDLDALNECYEWMKYRVLIFDLDDALKAVLPVKRAKKPAEVPSTEEPTYPDPRFSQVEF